MIFEKALELMRDGHTVEDRNGYQYKLVDGTLLYRKGVSAWGEYGGSTSHLIFRGYTKVLDEMCSFDELSTLQYATFLGAKVYKDLNGRWRFAGDKKCITLDHDSKQIFNLDNWRL